MGEVLIKMKIMPEDADTDMDKLVVSCKKVAEEQGAALHQKEIEPIAFGLNALIVIMSIEESKGISKLEEAMESLPLVSTIETLDVRRAIG